MEQELIPHLFRTEFRKITSVLGSVFGLEHIQIAEDIASDTFLAAFESWSYQGLPENPTAWLYQVARNKARNYLKHRAIFRQKVSFQVKSVPVEFPETDIDLSEKNIKDSELRMIFAVCHSCIPREAQIGLSLRILCGLGIEEIAHAFLTSKEVINKRLYRAREKLRSERVNLSFPDGPELNNRLEAVLTTLYLLFSEGYYSETRDTQLQEDLCLEAMRLTQLLLGNGQTNQSKVNALYSLMCFHASRFEARMGKPGEWILYQDQDDRLWNQELIAEGIYYLHQASVGTELSKYHLEAGIAYWHTIKQDSREKWESILHLHDLLLKLDYSPVAALNRIYALLRARGKEEALAEAMKLNIPDNHFYFILLGELYRDQDKPKAIECLGKAFRLAQNQPDKLTIQEKIRQLSQATDPPDSRPAIYT